MAFDSLNSQMTIAYYNTITDTYYSNNTVSWGVNDQYLQSQISFDLGFEPAPYTPVYAKCSSGNIKVDRTGTDLINVVSFCIAYGHNMMDIYPSVSFPTGLSISYAIHMENLGEQSVVIYK